MERDANIVLGTWSWGVGGFAGGDKIFGNSLDTKDLEEVFDTALSNGLNIFDTAYPYALGQSERILGELIKKYGRNKVIISDKFTPGLHNDNAENPVIDMLEGSLERLGTDFIDIYWIHSSDDVERFTPLLAKAVETGKIGRVGVSNHDINQVKRAKEILDGYGVKLSAVQNHFSLLYRTSIEDGLLDYCKDNDIEFFSYMVLEQGALSGKYDENNLLPQNSRRGEAFNALFPKMRDLLNNLRELARKYSVSPAQIATAWAIGRGTTPILGVTKVAQVEDAVKAKQVHLTDEEVANLEQIAINAHINAHGGWEGRA